jgi:hypothetical protein
LPTAASRPAAWSPFALRGGAGHPPGPPRAAAWAPPKAANATNAAPPPNGPAPNGATATASEGPPLPGYVSPGHATASRQVDARNAWDEMMGSRMRNGRAWKNDEVPQGETNLVHVWARIVLNDGVPPSAATIWLDRIDPLEGRYQIQIPGQAVAGDERTPPSSALYIVADKQRRQPQIAEKFVARIEAVTPGGGLTTLGGGEICFPANPNAQQSSQWATPAPPWAPQGYGPPGYPPQGYSPPGYPPPYGYPSPYGLPPMMGGYGTHPALAAAYAAPPAKVQNDPELSRIWATMQQTTIAAEASRSDQQFKMFQLMLEQRKEPAKAEVDSFTQLERMFSLAKMMADMGGGKNDGSGGLHFHEMKDGTQIVADGGGTVNKELTGLLLAKDAIGKVSSSIGARMAARAAGPGVVSGPGGAGKPPGPPKEFASGTK